MQFRSKRLLSTNVLWKDVKTNSTFPTVDGEKTEGVPVQENVKEKKKHRGETPRRDSHKHKRTLTDTRFLSTGPRLVRGFVIFITQRIQINHEFSKVLQYSTVGSYYIDMDGDALKKKNPELYRIAHEGGTEPIHSGKYVDTTEVGIYHCAVCGAALFSSTSKFISDSGWPAFTKPIADVAVILIKEEEYGTKSVDVRCATCDAHLGHVFPDGPEENGKTSDRYCINSISLELSK